MNNSIQDFRFFSDFIAVKIPETEFPEQSQVCLSEVLISRYLNSVFLQWGQFND